MVTIESIKPVTNAGNVRAFCAVNISNKVRITDVRVIQSPGQRAWVSMPSKCWETKDGKRQFTAIVEILDKDLKDQISHAVLTLYASLDGAPSEREYLPEGI
jgi:DNA-binding cell septation regulator SpoVG